MLQMLRKALLRHNDNIDAALLILVGSIPGLLILLAVFPMLFLSPEAAEDTTVAVAFLGVLVLYPLGALITRVLIAFVFRGYTIPEYGRDSQYYVRQVLSNVSWGWMAYALYVPVVLPLKFLASKTEKLFQWSMSAVERMDSKILAPTTKQLPRTRED